MTTFFKKLKDESGFMGPTHALSALAMFLLLTAVGKGFMIRMLGVDNPAVYIMAGIIVIGASLMPDMDSPQSTSISTLGVLGKAMSAVMRSTSLLIQNTFKSKYDKHTDNPHRGFWHTFLAAVLAGLAVGVLTGIKTIVPIQFTQRAVSVGMIAAAIIVYSSLMLSFASLFGKQYKKMKSKGLMVKLGFSIVSFVISAAAILTLPSDISYGWLGFAFALGWTIHIIGDMFTVAGVPVLFPIKIKGKRWWNLRMPIRIKAGGSFEYGVFVPIFIVISIASLVAILIT